MPDFAASLRFFIVILTSGAVPGPRMGRSGQAKTDRVRTMDSMAQGDGSGRGFWWGLLAAIIAAGLLSRAAHTGLVLIDKYLGDALYAAMVYVLLRLTGRVQRVALWAAVTMAAIELFQLTGVPAAMYSSGHTALRVAGRLLGTEFSVLDLLAYAVGIGALAALCRRR